MLTRPLRIALADADRAGLVQTRETLNQAGRQVVVEASSADELSVDNAEQFDLIVADVNVVASGGLHAIATMLERHAAPVVVTSASASDEAIALANECRPLAHLVKPIRQEDLRVSIALAMQRFEELRRLQDEAASTRQALEDRKVIERAKGVVMRQRGLDEAAAFQHIQKSARDQRQPLIVVAKSILIAECALK
jgi:response regulator NasT